MKTTRTRFHGRGFGGMIILLCSAILVPLPAFSGDVPSAINYQGKLTDNLGNPVTGGYYHITFRIWDHPTLTNSADLIWGRTFPLHVMDDGIFNILLTDDGGTVTNPAPQVPDLRDAFAEEDRYLGLMITQTPAGPVGSPTEISPRQRLVSAPYTFHAQHATDASSATEGFTVDDGLVINSGGLNVHGLAVMHDGLVVTSGVFQAHGAAAMSGGLTITAGGLQVHDAAVFWGATTISNSLKVAGAMTVSGAVTVSNNLAVASPSVITGYGTIPIGGIVIWYGATNAIPDGWALCDGGTYYGHATPDLRDRFVVGAGLNYPVNTTGGEAFHQLTPGEMPKHSHTRREGKFESWGGHGAYSDVWVSYSDNTYYTGDAGNDQPHENRPPYHALCYIMRVK
ncbi:MAG: hypothetical protein KA248_05805 [Kiritimatiellae bacterium]|nr:hypothetical protein [Kiritimatiellia bacterium]